MKRFFHFILCSNRPFMAEECTRYLNRLYMPEGWRKQITVITDAKSMCEGYNRSIDMQPGDAPRTEDVPLRIYLHQDVFIINRHFLFNLLTLFSSHPDVGMIGMAGTPKMHPSGVWWNGEGVGSLYEVTDDPFTEEFLKEDTRLNDVECIDGFLIATRIDIPWREDLFDGFDFYDVSQSFEMRHAGYRVAIPDMHSPWCVHDDGLMLSLYRYNHYRKAFLESYGSEL